MESLFTCSGFEPGGLVQFLFSEGRENVKKQHKNRLLTHCVNTKFNFNLFSSKIYNFQCPSIGNITIHRYALQIVR